MNLTLIGSEELEQFYKQKFYFSYSGINKLLFSPIMFYNHYVLQQREDSTDAHLVAGRALHCLLLEPSNFDKQFLTLPGKIPTDSQKKIIDNIFKYHLSMGNNTLTLGDYSQEILTHLLTSNLYQTLKTDQQRLDKILTLENIEYFEFLKASLDKTVIDQVTLDGCNASLEALKTNSDVRAFFQLDRNLDNTEIDVFNEQLLSTDDPNLPFGFKGILDNVVIDHSAKVIFINDLKTTGKPLQDFPEAVAYYRYWIQAVIYSILVTDKYLINLPEPSEWKVKITFIVIDKYNQVYPFQVSDETLEKWAESFNELVDKLKWHYENKRYDLPYELAIGNLKL
jgi:hypothetical protein